MAVCDLKEIYNAVQTYYADPGDVELIPIMNAFGRSMEEDLLVITRTETVDGEEYTTLALISDDEDHALFPLFTNMQELIPVKEALDSFHRTDVNILNLKYVLEFLIRQEVCDGIVVNPDSQTFTMPMRFYEDVLKRDLTSHITLINADITRMYTGAIVGFTDEHISGTAGADAAIQKAGGEELRAKFRGEQLNIGDVIGDRSTGDLCAELVLMTRSPEYSENMKYDALYACYYNCMNVAQQAQCTSIAFPCIGPGDRDIPMDIVTYVSTKAVSDWLGKHGDYKIDVYFCCEREEDKAAYQQFFDGLV